MHQRFNEGRFYYGLAALLLLAGCDRTDHVLTRQAANDPPQLWSIEVTDASARPGDKPIQICADTLLRTGFLNQHAATCVMDRPPVLSPSSASVHCVQDGTDYAVVNTARGDMDRDFEVTFTMTSIGSNDVRMAQTRRYRKVGACPAGWINGDATDRYGNRAPNGTAL